MSINPLEIYSPTASARQKSPTALTESHPQGQLFEEVLAAAGDGVMKPERVAAAAAATAEVLRLEMMRRAVSLDNPDVNANPSPGNLTMKALLASFLEQSQNTVVAPPGLAPEVDKPAAAVGGEVANPSLETIIRKASTRYGVEEGLIKAVIKAESNFNPRAVSHAGAQGLMQLMPATARGLGVTDSFDPEQNVMAGTRFLKDMLNRYGGNLDAALAAYNWGPGNVDKRGNFLPRETREYLVQVKGYYSQFTG